MYREWEYTKYYILGASIPTQNNIQKVIKLSHPVLLNFIASELLRLGSLYGNIMIPNEHIVCLVPSNEFEGI